MPPLVLTREIWALAWPAILRNAAGCAADRLTLAFVGLAFLVCWRYGFATTCC